MYNGIGLTTPRGSATSGHVTKNMSYIKPDFFRKKLDANTGRQEAISNLAASQAKANDDILTHNRKREMEAKMFEMQEDMLEQGYTDEEIESKVSEFKEKFMQSHRGGSDGKSKKSQTTDTHEIFIQKSRDNERMKNAFGISSKFVEGEAFDPEIQEQKKKERAIERELKAQQKEDDRIKRAADREKADKAAAFEEEQRKTRDAKAGRDTDRYQDRDREGERSRYRDDSRAEGNSRDDVDRGRFDDHRNRDDGRDRGYGRDRQRTGEGVRNRHDEDNGRYRDRDPPRDHHHRDSRFNRDRDNDRDGDRDRDSDYRRGGGSGGGGGAPAPSGRSSNARARIISTVLSPGFRANLTPSCSLIEKKQVVQVADTTQLYRVFERC